MEFKDRLNEWMHENKIRQIDIANKAKVNKKSIMTSYNLIAYRVKLIL